MNTTYFCTGEEVRLSEVKGPAAGSPSQRVAGLQRKSSPFDSMQG